MVTITLNFNYCIMYLDHIVYSIDFRHLLGYLYISMSMIKSTKYFYDLKALNIILANLILKLLEQYFLLVSIRQYKGYSIPK